MFMLQDEIPKKFDENMNKKFANTYKLCSHDINKFTLLLQKGLYGWLEKNQRKIINWKRKFYSHLNIKDNTDTGYTPTKNVCKNFNFSKILTNTMICILKVIHYC